MIEIIREAGFETAVEYSVDFYNEEGRVCLSFPSNEAGEAIITPENKDNYEFGVKKCTEGTFYRRIIRHSWRYRANAIAKCHCGAEIELYNEYLGACECPECGRWYNLFGQELNNPEEWESGEGW